MPHWLPPKVLVLALLVIVFLVLAATKGILAAVGGFVIGAFVFTVIAVLAGP